MGNDVYYPELVSLSNSNRSIDAWHRGGFAYYSPTALGGYDSCTAEKIVASKVNLQTAALKAPMKFYMPNQSGKYAIAPVICSVGLDYTSERSFSLPLLQEQVTNNIRKIKHGWWGDVTNTSVVTAVLSERPDEYGFWVRNALNVYLVEDRAIESTLVIGAKYCNKALEAAAPFRCEPSNGLWRVTYTHPQTNRKMYVTAFEEYSMRKMTSSLVINSRQINNYFGFGVIEFNGGSKVWDNADVDGKLVSDGNPVKVQEHVVLNCPMKLHKNEQPYFDRNSCALRTAQTRSGSANLIPVTVTAATSYNSVPGKVNKNRGATLGIDIKGLRYGFFITKPELAVYTALIPSSTLISDIKFSFDNNGIDSDGFDRNLIINKVVFKGKLYISNNVFYAAGYWDNSTRRCVAGAFKTNLLACSGYLQFRD